MVTQTTVVQRLIRAIRGSPGRATRAVALSSALIMVGPCGPSDCAPSGGGGGVVYLTFDDGPSSYTNAVLDVLGRHGAKATFFVIGSSVDGRRSTTAAIRQRGHEIGNHTWSHPDLTSLSDSGVRDQLLRTDDVITAATGRGSDCVRPPGGSISSRVRSIISSLGMRTVMWSIDTLDWSDSATVSSIKRQLDKAQDGSIIVLHDGGGNQSATVQAVDQWLSANGGRFSFRSLDC